jgi:hypothetical protein
MKREQSQIKFAAAEGRATLEDLLGDADIEACT